MTQQLPKPFSLILILIFSVLSGIFVFSSNAFATDRANNIGYFHGNQIKHTDDSGTESQIGNVINNGVPLGSVPKITSTSASAQSTGKANFINYINSIISSGSAKDRIGANYIVQTMRGPDDSGDWDHDIPSASDIADWEDKINNSNVIIYDQNYDDKENTHRIIDKSDYVDIATVIHKTSSSVPSIVFYDKNSSDIFYIIRRECANPIGQGLPGLPPTPTPAGWTSSLKSSLRLNQSGLYQLGNVYATTSDGVAWRHTVRNLGPGELNTSVLLVNSGDLSPWAGSAKNLNIPFVEYGALEFYYSPADDDSDVSLASRSGQTLCQAVKITPGSSDSGISKTSSKACVIVSDPPINWEITPFTDIYVNGVYKGTSTMSNEYIANAKLGDSITWVSSIRNTGTDTASGVGLQYRWQNDGDMGVGTGALTSVASLSAGDEKSITTNYTPGAAGSRYCRNTYVTTTPTGGYGTQNACANVTDAPVDDSWSVSPNTQVSSTSSTTGISTGFLNDRERTNALTVEVGDTYKWNHQLIKSGSGTIDKDIEYRWGQFDYVSAESQDDNAGYVYSGTVMSDGDIDQIESYEFTADISEVGHDICRWTTSIADGDVQTSSRSCITVVNTPPPEDFSDWDLEPDIRVRVKSLADGGWTTYFEGATADIQVGDTVQWVNKVENKGTTGMDQIVDYYYVNGSSFEYFGLGDLSDDVGGEHSVRLGAYEPDSDLNDTNSFYSTASFGNDFVAKVEDVGETFCRKTYIHRPKSSAHPDWDAWSDWACVKIIAPVVVPEYELTPFVTLNPSDTVIDSDSITATPSVNYAGTTAANGIHWQLTKIIVPAWTDLGTTASGDSTNAPCAYFAVGVCTDTINGNGNFSSNSPSTFTKLDGSNFWDTTYNITEPIGTKICYALSVKPHNPTKPAGEWRHSALKCATVAKKPKVQIWGGDLITNGDVQTSKTIRATNMFGSWDEYGVLAHENIITTPTSGKIVGIGSGAAFASLAGLNTHEVCDYNKISFNNANGLASCSNTGTIGMYNNSTYSQPDIAGIFPDAGATAISGTKAPSLLSSAIYEASGDITLNESTLTAGQSIIIKSDGKVTIAGDQKYADGPYTNASQIPQLVIIAKKIVINADVTQVDAWLVANLDGTDGIIETCNTGSATFKLEAANRLTVAKCNKQLKINGPVIAKKLWLRRTFGAGTNASAPYNDASHPGTPAEIINLRADAYLWAAARSTNTSSMNTVYTSEAPVRY